MRCSHVSGALLAVDVRYALECVDRGGRLVRPGRVTKLRTRLGVASGLRGLRCRSFAWRRCGILPCCLMRAALAGDGAGGRRRLSRRGRCLQHQRVLLDGCCVDRDALGKGPELSLDPLVHALEFGLDGHGGGRSRSSLDSVRLVNRWDSKESSWWRQTRGVGRPLGLGRVEVAYKAPGHLRHRVRLQLGHHQVDAEILALCLAEGLDDLIIVEVPRAVLVHETEHVLQVVAVDANQVQRLADLRHVVAGHQLLH
mmetsp:Transcript_61851/g.85245  ORF Transcript_61851/g.85245 Transcript_61851/m.85245 type:complete len:255 (+) Transcript_61851:229-993(+)